MGSCHTERLHVTKLLLPLELISIDWSCNAVCAHADSPTVGQKASTFELRPGEGGGGGGIPFIQPFILSCHRPAMLGQETSFSLGLGLLTGCSREIIFVRQQNDLMLLGDDDMMW